MNTLNVSLIIIFIFVLLFSNSKIEEFRVSTQFFEPSDNYSLMNRVNFYNRLRCVFGGCCDGYGYSYGYW